ncbi:CPSF A subunit region-domain-containing protein [Lentinula aciculospora]|uniref:CPSF A subunit region-domain-containing protein n=1 Tax=Lentinula aciculospora TaxID=153920 RepID=A0A9W9AQA2_9AGAR|nr:CPSF A subunit region-domain-containing protein [Lentinula aciculospora]
MPTRIASTFHPSSSVISSVKCSLSLRELEHLVVAKLNSLQVYSILESKLQLECNLEVRGKVRLVRAIPIQNSFRSNLLVLLDHPDPEILILNYTETLEPGSGRLNLKHQIPLDERGSRPSEFCTDAIVHSSGLFAVVSCYTGKLKVVIIETGEVHNLPLPELNLLSLTFLPLVREDNYALALLHIDYNEHIQLVSRNLHISTDSGPELDTTDYSNLLQPTSISYKNIPIPDEAAIHLIPIPADDDCMDYDDDDDENDTFFGGILVVGGSKILLYELTSQEAQELKPAKGKRKQKRVSKKQSNETITGPWIKQKKEIKRREPRATVDWPWSRVSAWTTVDEFNNKILIGDAFGRLAMLSLVRFKDFGMVLLPLGETSPSTSISYLSNQVTFIGSHFGDSQLVRISQVSLSTSKDTPTLPIPGSVTTTISPESFNKLDDDKGKGPSLHDNRIKKGRIVASLGSFLDVIQTFKNIAPIRDAVLADLDGSRQGHIVTCSGGGNTGSVNVVRIGADFEEMASILGMENIIDLWPIKLSYDASAHSYFITSTILDSHIFQIISHSQMKCVDSSHEFVLRNQTLYVGNMALKSNGKYDRTSALVVQVVPDAALLFQYDTLFQKWVFLHRVDAEMVGSHMKFVKASGNASQLLIAQAGGWLATYTVQMQEGGLELVRTTSRKLDYAEQKSILPSEPVPSSTPEWYNTEISAITCPLLDPTKYFSRIIAAAFWHTNQLKLYTFNQVSGELELLCQSRPGALTSPVRSILLNYMTTGHYRLEDQHSHLCVFAGLANGSVVSFEMVLDEQGGQNKAPELKDMNVISLGDIPVSFSQYEADGKRVVVAAGSRAVVYSWEGSYLRSMPVMLKDITSVTSFNTESYPNSLILATNTGISIGRVKGLEKMHIRSTSLGLHTPYHIVHEPKLRVFGVGTLYTEPCGVGEEEKVTSSLRLLDDASLEVLAQAELQQNEHLMSITVLNVHINNDDGNNDSQPLFCVGTFFVRLDESEPTSGRILLFKAHQTGPTWAHLRCVATEDVAGCVYSLVAINGFLAAAINSSVSLYRVMQILEKPVSSTPLYTFHSVTDWNHNYIVTCLSAYGDHLVVADQLTSVSLLKLNENQKLKTVAKDYSPLWPISVEAADDKSFIGADQSLNLFTFSPSNTASNRTLLVQDGFYHVGDLVTKFIKGSLTSSDASLGKFKSTHLFCTQSGQIGVIINVENENIAKALSALELQLGQKSVATGGISHAKHRAPRLSKGRSDADTAAYGILDGDLLEQMLTYMNTDPELAKEVYTLSVAGNDFPYAPADLKKDLELLQNMH